MYGISPFNDLCRSRGRDYWAYSSVGVPAWNTGRADVTEPIISLCHICGILQTHESSPAAFEGTTGPTPYHGFHPGMPGALTSLYKLCELRL